MRKIDVSQIVDPNIQQPFTGLSLDFLQTGEKQMIFAICQNILKSKGFAYSATVPYLISPTSNAGFTSDGIIFYGGELYIMRENVASLQYTVIDTTPDATADPLLFTDNVSRNVHNNRYLTFSASATGALFDFNNIVDATGLYQPATVVGSGGSAPAFGSGWTAVDGVAFRKSGSGLIALNGSLQKTTNPTGVMFVLPTGYRPLTYDRYFPVYILQGATIASAILVIDTSGNVGLLNPSASANTYVYLEGISFFIS